MKVVTLGLIIAGLSLFILNNLQPISLVLFGTQLPWQLPLAIWLVFCLVLGVITSLILQFLYGLGRNSQKTPAKSQPYTSIDSPGFTSDYSSSPKTQYQAPNNQAKQSTTSSNISSPPDYEKPQNPENTYNKGSVYSFQYRPSAKQEEDKKEQTNQVKKDTPSSSQPGVYDANYRVITPPFSSNTPPSNQSTPEEDEEEWI